MQELTFIWDMDGTLVDSYPAIVPAAAEALAALGLPVEEEALRRRMLRSSVKAVLEELASENGLDAAALRADFARSNDSHISAIPAMPHAAETLSALRAAGHRSFVYTHRGASCPVILEQTGLRGYFTEVVTALQGFPRKPAPDGILYLIGKYGLDPARCWYVGDRRLDVEAAENAGIGSILLRTAESPVLATGREGHVIGSLAEIPGLFGIAPVRSGDRT